MLMTKERRPAFPNDRGLGEVGSLIEAGAIRRMRGAFGAGRADPMPASAPSSSLDRIRRPAFSRRGGRRCSRRAGHIGDTCRSARRVD